MPPEFIDDSIYALLVGGPWAFEFVGWADRDLLLRDGRLNPVPVTRRQQECIGLHWTQLYTPASLGVPKVVPAAGGVDAVDRGPWLSA
jgi:hypothetical protein